MFFIQCILIICLQNTSQLLSPPSFTQLVLSAFFINKQNANNKKQKQQKLWNKHPKSNLQNENMQKTNNGEIRQNKTKCKFINTAEFSLCWLRSHCLDTH